MITDYRKVIEFIRKLNNYSLRKYNKALVEVDIDKLFLESDYLVEYNQCKEALATDCNNGEFVYARDYYNSNISDIDKTRKVEDMSDNDLMNLVNCIRYSQVGDLLILRYDEVKIFNNKVVKRNSFEIYDGILRECRSIVLDIVKFEVVSLPFYKFMNMNESEEYSEKSILNRLAKASTVEYTDKLDGSFIQITKLERNYPFYKYTDLLASSRNIENTEIVREAREWYEGHRDYKRLVEEYSDYTLMFEWVSLNDKHVVKYDLKDCGLYLIGMRHKETGDLLNYKEVIRIAEEYKVWHTKYYDITYDKMKESLSTFKASEKEGYVINIDGFLVKMKCSDYLGMVNILKEYGHENVVIKAVSDNKIDEVLLVLPEEYHERTRRTVDSIYEYIAKMDKTVKEISEYALEHQDTDIKIMSAWFNRLPKLVRGTVKRRYFNSIRNIPGDEVDYLRTNHIKMVDNYINLAELTKRQKVLDSINVDNYRTL